MLFSQGEIILVDDGSTDTTWAEAQAAAVQYPCARLFRHRKSFGLTEALRTSFRNCRGDIVVFLPGEPRIQPRRGYPQTRRQNRRGVRRGRRLAAGSSHKTTVTALDLAAQLDHATAPKLAQEAYLRAKIKNTSPFILLPGRANIFRRADFVGATDLETIAPNEEFEAHLGRVTEA